MLEWLGFLTMSISTLKYSSGFLTVSMASFLVIFPDDILSRSKTIF